MGSTALVLVNDILLLTGDNAALTTISGSVGSIGDRIVGFMNLTISDVEKRANWPELRVNAQGISDGITGVMDYTGVGDVRADSAVSVRIDGQGLLQEVTPEQFDIIVAGNKVTGLPAIFQRGSTLGGALEIQIYPTPAVNTVIDVSAYKRATRFTTSDTSTTEIDDDLIRYGALMHMDAYDGMDRGYAALFKGSLDGAVLKLYSNANYQVMIEDYA